jgi:hypothetical protein
VHLFRHALVPIKLLGCELLNNLLLLDQRLF